MKKVLQFFFSLFVILQCSIVFADQNLLEDCKPINLVKSTINLKEKLPNLIVIYNKTKTNLWITHPITNPSASAGWSSHLHPNKWSVLALNENPFELSCVESKPGHEQQISCLEVILLCKWTKKTKLKLKANENTYWFAEDLTKKQLWKRLNDFRKHSGL